MPGSISLPAAGEGRWSKRRRYTTAAVVVLLVAVLAVAMTLKAQHHQVLTLGQVERRVQAWVVNRDPADAAITMPTAACQGLADPQDEAFQAGESVNCTVYATNPQLAGRRIVQLEADVVAKDGNLGISVVWSSGG